MEFIKIFKLVKLEKYRLRQKVIRTNIDDVK